MSEPDPMPQAGLPSLTVAQIKFSDGTTIDVSDDDVVVFVGPNNSGKSMALRQIEWAIGTPKSYNVVNHCEVRRVGDTATMANHVKEHSQRVYIHSNYHLVGYDFSFFEVYLERNVESQSDELRDFFVIRLPTDSRLSGSDPAKSIAYRQEQPTHPLHILVTRRDIEARVSNVFRSAFGMSLYVNRAGGAKVDLYVGQLPIEELPSDPFDAQSREFFSNAAHPLHLQGDGMRAFATLLLNTLALSQQRVVLIDEPEAFLHPPQARLIGRALASESTAGRQIFIATHSSDVLKGVIENAPAKVKLLRIVRDGKVNRVKSLDPNLTRELSSDPLVSYSGLFDGVFYKHVIICESDSDCQFYSTMISDESVSEGTQPDVLFIQSSGKHRVAKLARFAHQLGIPCSSILDIDVINDKTTFKHIAEAFDIKWANIEPLWKEIYQAISAQKARLTLGQVIQAIEDSVAKAKKGEIGLTELMTDVRESIRQNSPWDMIKRSGREALPRGEAVNQFDKLLSICSEHGLWIVPVGELEGFCRTATSKKGASWVVDVLERYDFTSAPELTAARTFMRAIWRRII